jgi:hypothetical protein
LRPIGLPQVAIDDTIDGRRVALDETRLTLGSAFGDAMSGQEALGRAMVLDAYDRPYSMDFSQLVSGSASAVDLEQKLLDQLHYRDLTIPSFDRLGLDARLGFSEPIYQPIDGSARAALQGGTSETGQSFERLSFEGIELPYGDLALGLGLSASDVTTASIDSPANGLFLDAAALLTPADSLIDRGTGGSLSVPLGDSTALRIGLLDSTDLGTESDNGEGTPGRLAALGATHRLSDATMLSLTYAYVDEASGLLGSRASGAFTLADGAVSHLGTARLGYRANRRLELFAQATLGVSKLQDEGGLLHDWRDVRSDAFAVGLVAVDVASDGDRLGLVLGQPLRVSSASAMLDLPTARTLDGRVERSQERVEVTPSGREIRLELAYQRNLDETSAIGTWLLVQHEPGHDATADPAMGIGLRYTNRF